MSATAKKIILLRPRGFCAGVVRAIDVVKIALNLYGAPIYVRKEIVHNRHVVEELRGAGAIFVEELDEVPAGGRGIFSAHGVAPAVREEARARSLKVIDATCPLVTKVHLEAVKFARKGYTIILIGHKDHDEVIGTLGEAPESTTLVSTVEDVDRLELNDPERVSFITQTTLSLDETREIVERDRFRVCLQTLVVSCLLIGTRLGGSELHLRFSQLAPDDVLVWIDLRRLLQHIAQRSTLEVTQIAAC